MQYLLTEEEYRSLKKKQSIEIKNNTKLMEICKLAAEHIPCEHNNEPWGCVLNGMTPYCDKCPVQEICPYEPKRWSK